MKQNIIIVLLLGCMLATQLCFNGMIYAAQTLTAKRVAPKDPITKEFIARYLPSNPVILEAGAYNGEDTKIMSRMWPNATIHAFEPIPETFMALKKTVKNCSNVNCYMNALGSKNETAIMYVSSTADGQGKYSSSLFKPLLHLDMFGHIAFNEKIEISVLTIDTWAQENNIDHVDFLWLDLQGGEYNALKNSPTILKTVQVIFTEVSLIQLYEGNPLYPEFKKWLEEEGFVVVKEALMPAIGYGDVLFVRP